MEEQQVWVVYEAPSPEVRSLGDYGKIVPNVPVRVARPLADELLRVEEKELPVPGPDGKPQRLRRPLVPGMRLATPEEVASVEAEREEAAPPDAPPLEGTEVKPRKRSRKE